MKTINRLLNADDVILTDGKKMEVYTSWAAASDAQLLKATRNPNKPIYLLKVASIQLFTNEEVSKINATTTH